MESNTDDKWCYCGEGEHGEMIGCDSENCKIKWFHIERLKIPKVPKGKWYCPDRRKNKPSHKRKPRSITSSEKKLIIIIIIIKIISIIIIW